MDPALPADDRLKPHPARAAAVLVTALAALLALPVLATDQRAALPPVRNATPPVTGPSETPPAPGRS